MPESAAQYPHIDRAEQLRSAARLTARDRLQNADRQALFVEGPQDIGKSSLLFEIYERHAAESVYFVDLSRIVAQHEILEELAVQARSQQIEVPGYRAARDRFAEQSVSPQVDFSRVRVRNSTIQLLTQAEDRSLQTASLTDALLDNLVVESRRPVICFDGFEACARPMRDWLGRSLLPNLLSRPEVSVFVAGREVPSLSRPYTRSVHTLVLPPFDVAAVTDWIEALGFASLREKAETIHVAYGGVPGLLAEYFAHHVEPDGTARSEPAAESAHAHPDHAAGRPHPDHPDHPAVQAHPDRSATRTRPDGHRSPTAPEDPEDPDRRDG
jgi:hypothetical protein